MSIVREATVGLPAHWSGPARRPPVPSPILTGEELPESTDRESCQWWSWHAPCTEQQQEAKWEFAQAWVAFYNGRFVARQKSRICPCWADDPCLADDVLAMAANYYRAWHSREATPSTALMWMQECLPRFQERLDLWLSRGNGDSAAAHAQGNHIDATTLNEIRDGAKWESEMNSIRELDIKERGSVGESTQC